VGARERYDKKGEKEEGEKEGERRTYGLTILTSTPHDNISRTSLCLLSLLMRLIRLKSTLGGSEK
jgi:hypothetical protein